MLRRLPLVGTGVFALALAARAAITALGGGLLGMGNYDDGVYFSASLALLHGRLPYADFLFLQPPGILLVLAPFAALAPLIGDASAFAAARIGFMVLGGINAVLVVVALRRFGLAAATTGGVVYATSLAAAHTERSTLLEPVGTFGTLVGVAVLLRPDASVRPGSRHDRVLLVLAGCALGLGVSTKIFFAVAASIIVVAAIMSMGRRAGWLVLGCLVPGLAAGSSMLASPAAAWRQVVLDQVGRPTVVSSSVRRLESILFLPHVPGVPAGVVLVAALTAVLGLCLLALRVRGGGLPVALLLASVPVLLSAPSFYRHYAALTAAPLALVVGIGVGELLGRVRLARRVPATVVAVLLLAGLSLAGWRGSGVRSFVSPPLPADLLASVRAVPGCVTSDDPSVLVFAGTLSRTLDRGCPFWPDTTGWLYDADAAPRTDRTLRPEDNPAWQAHAYAYLTSGDATVLVRRRDGLSRQTRQRIGVTRSWDGGHHVFVEGAG